ncbi:peptidase M24, structural domain-containing protein [Radiomyces spectabilis]|uniref:peptidase M24, structural domain-containing protein n=1 Tax=Radiomyces spectabilis TaxID=64574 RepID=UPI00221F70C8|nr:peptidase M24, structural domain-containing protein [Radiomyces spectabilis]KAI8373025.1 peptidase M24, structural domain-containing protein [Radiomyces spectabilis]
MLATASTTLGTERLSRLRNVMSQPEYQLDAFVVPSEDAHQSEYTAECDNRRAWISGFTGSAGCAVISQTNAALFTDGRYFLQASQELSNDWELKKQGLPGVPTWQEYLVKDLPRGSHIGVDPSVITVDNGQALERELGAVGSRLVPVEKNLVDVIRSDRPSRPAHTIHVHDVKYAGKSHQAKIKQLRKELNEKSSDGTVVSALDEIAWLLNLRGSDIHCCPIFFGYCVVTQQEAVLYLDPQQQLTNDVASHLQTAGVHVRPYSQIFHDLPHYHGRFLLDPKLTSLSVAQALGNDRVDYAPSPITLAKAIKNDAELQGMRASHLRDAVAVSQHFAWLENALVHKRQVIREAEAADHLESMRKQQEEYVGLAFDTIAATGPNGAIIHYSPGSFDSAVIDPKQIYLCDSGAQYKDGTTDITRTYLFDGEPTAFQTFAFTKVLQSHMALDQAVFPQGTTGYQLDPIARQPMWQEGLDFRHGTGHGVGAYLNVHEGPHGIGSRASYNEIPLQEGMIVTNEPGYYEDGQFGIRIENVLAVQKAPTKYQYGDQPYLGFEHLTWVPLGRRLLDTNVLTCQDKAWINRYHQACREKLEPLLGHDTATLSWLVKETEPI